jgi:ABC-type antimicrobial peptide transport system permease subunit
LTGIAYVDAPRGNIRALLREIGIRLALGADQPQILRLIIVQGLKLTVTGICIGVAIGLALSRFMNNLLFGVAAFRQGAPKGAARPPLLRMVSATTPAFSARSR